MFSLNAGSNFSLVIIHGTNPLLFDNFFQVPSFTVIHKMKNHNSDHLLIFF